jgi:uncharacterized protein
MARPEAMSEPSMEEILASIRKIIAEEPGASPYPGIDRRRGPAPAPRTDTAPPPVPSNGPAAGHAAAPPPAPRASSLDDDLADLLDAPKAPPAGAPQTPSAAAHTTTGGSNGHDETPNWLLSRVAPQVTTPPMPPPRAPDLGAVRPTEALFAPVKAAAPVAQKTEPVPVPPPAAKSEAPVAQSPPTAATVKTVGNSGSPLPPFPVPATAKPVAPPPLQPMATLYGREEPVKTPEPPAKPIEAASGMVKQPPAMAPLSVPDAKADIKKVEEAPKMAAPPPAAKPVQVKAVQVKPPASVQSPVFTGALSEPVKSEVSASTAPAGVQTMEDTVAELLRPMLRQWLDANMPRIVEKALRVEIAESLKKPAGLKN